MNTPAFRPAPWTWPLLVALMAVQALGGLAFEPLGINLSVLSSMLLGLVALFVRPRLLQRGAVWALGGLLVPLVLGLMALAATALFHASQSDAWPWLLIALGGAFALAAFELGPVAGFIVGIVMVRDPDLLQDGRFRRPPLRGIALLAVLPILAVTAGQWFGGPSRFAEAVRKRDVPTCRKLARRNSRLARAICDGKPSLMLAVRADDPETVELLLKHGADPRVSSAQFGRATALHWACLDTNVKDSQGFSDGGYAHPHKGAAPLRTAPKLVQVLLDAGADPNALDDWRATPLAWAACQGFQDLVEQLARAGASLKAMQDWQGPRILRDAVKVDARRTVSWLLDQGVSPHALPAGPGHDGVESPLFHVQSPAMARLLVARGADLREQNRFGETPLHGLLRHGASAKIVEAMIELGAPLEVADHKGITAAQAIVDWKRGRESQEDLRKQLEQLSGSQKRLFR
jgi:hypothetical protein